MRREGEKGRRGEGEKGRKWRKRRNNIVNDERYAISVGILPTRLLLF